jgi:hypothetical protein
VIGLGRVGGVVGGFVGVGEEFEVEQQNNWGHNMLPWKEGRKQQQQGSACFAKTAHRQEEEKFLSTARIFF